MPEKQPIAFGFGTAIVVMMGTNWGAARFGFTNFFGDARCRIECACRAFWIFAAAFGLLARTRAVLTSDDPEPARNFAHYREKLQPVSMSLDGKCRQIRPFCFKPEYESWLKQISIVSGS